MLCKYKYIAVLFLLCFYNILFAQESNTKNSLSTENKLVQEYLSLAEYYYDYKRNPDSIIHYAKKVSKLEQYHKSTEFLGESYWHIARGQLLKNQLDSTKLYIEKSVEISKTNQDYKLENISKLLLSRYFEKKNDLIKATKLCLEVIKNAENLNNYSLLIQAYCKLASTYALHDDNEKYKIYLDKAYRLMNEKDVEVPISVKSSIYTYLVDYFEQKRYKNPENKAFTDSILYYVDKGIRYTKSVKKTTSLVHLLGIKGKMFFLENDFKQAKSIYNEALSYRNDLDKFHLRGLYLKLAYVYLENNDNQTALLYKDSILQSISEEPSYYRKAERYNVAYHISKTANKYKLALEYHEKMTQNLNKAKDEKQIKALNELDIKYNTEKKDAEIAKQKLQNETLKNRAQKNYFILGLFAIIGFSVVLLLYFRNKNKSLSTQLDLVNTKAKLHRSQINPHFISNSINAIYPFLYDKSNPNKAAAYLSDLSQMIRSILDSTFETTWTLQEELKFVKQYCKIQNLKMDIPFDLSIEVTEDLNSITVPSLILQPFIENCFIHGFSNKKNSAEIYVKALSINSYLEIIITDNGDSIKVKNSNHVSRSAEITQQRILNAYSKKIIPNDFLEFGRVLNGYQVKLKIPTTLK